PGRPGRHPPALLKPTEWKTSAPIISEGKVVFTAPDSSSIHCLNLQDGLPVWSADRADDDLYLAGVWAGKVVIVGKKSIRALNVKDGKPAWKELETGVPSGQGVAASNVYYLPLKAGAQGKEPEVCAIDLDKGMVVAHIKSRKQDVPGNLIFFEDRVFSQTLGELVAYPQLKSKLEQIDKQLKPNPNDPSGLFQRGQLRLEQGNLQGAVD